MAEKKESKESVEEKKPKTSIAKKTKTTRKPAAKKKDPVEKKETKKEAEEKAPKKTEIVDETKKILKSSDVDLPPGDRKPVDKIVVSHKKASMSDDKDKLEIISADEVLEEMTDLEYDFNKHEIKPFKGKALTSHEMHQGKYGIIDDVTKQK